MLTVAGAAGAAEAARSEDCLACHADKSLERSGPARGQPVSVFVDAALLGGSVHAGLDCVACHTTATAPHEERLPRVRCAGCHDQVPAVLREGAHGGPAAARAGARAAMCAGCHGTHGVRPAASLGVAACATCHRTEVATYRESVHGRSQARGASEAATCRSCHGAAHGVLAAADNRAPTYHLNLPRTCAQCHASPELARRHDIPVGDVYKLYLDSIHGRALTRSGLMVAANCSDCHGVHDIRPAADPASKVFRSSIPRTCGTCHAGVLAAYAGSIHGQQVAGGNAGAPVCTSCHTAHQIRRVEAAPWQLEVIRECGTCHEESLKTYRDSFHGKVTSLGLARVAKCADCHGAHAIVPAADPRSTVAPEHIVATCRQCHPQANASFAQFHPHADPADKVRFPRLYYAYVTMNGLLASVFGFFGLHTLLWLPRSLAERWRRRRGGSGGEPAE